ncbi:MAG TPA: sulfite oxidase-like oxidoreductase [Verrucomicrobiae bacterium]|nr:sulfite oxidase-like oxidoreductase [Verrucomicrobiae bacterium]
MRAARNRGFSEDLKTMFAEITERKRLEREMREAGRLPPGQSLTLKWPVLHEGSVPRFDPATWDFRITGLVEKPVRLTWDEFSRLPMTSVTADMHCVTRWSRFDVRWEGVAFGEVMKMAGAKPEAKYVMVEAEQGYTSNVPLADLMRPTTLFALKHNGEALPPEHGYPVRLVVPNLYAWKSVKWVRGIEFMAEDRPGFWEENGYHIYGDPFLEERFSG